MDMHVHKVVPACKCTEHKDDCMDMHVYKDDWLANGM